jgi:hypothetical protein
MADLLKRQFDLLALQAALRLENGVQKVDFRLEHFGNDGEPLLDAWTIDASLLQEGSSTGNLSSQLTTVVSGEPTPPPTIPGAPGSSQLNAVGNRVAKTLVELKVAPHIPIWLHLAKPYGWLGILPWEAALEEPTGRSALRLPDFLERPRENVASLDVVVCCDLVEDSSTVEQLERVIHAALNGSPRTQTRVTVFALPENCRALRTTFKADSRVWMAPSPSLTGNSGSSAWFSAITLALRERSADVVHFICRASAVAGRASLRLADPGGQDSQLATARFPSIGEVSALLTGIGAWAAIFTLPRGEPDSRLRWFADALAQARPGCVLFDGGGDLTQFYHFLFSPEPSDPPPLGANFIYCQPATTTTLEDPTLARIVALGQNAELFLSAASKVTGNSKLEAAAAVVGKVVSVIPAIAEVLGLRAPTAPAGPSATPTWLAAAQRYVEAVSLEIVRSSAKDPLLADHFRTVARQGGDHEVSNPAQAEASDVVAQTLSQLQTIIAKHASNAE